MTTLELLALTSQQTSPADHWRNKNTLIIYLQRQIFWKLQVLKVFKKERGNHLLKLHAERVEFPETNHAICTSGTKVPRWAFNSRTKLQGPRVLMTSDQFSVLNLPLPLPIWFVGTKPERTGLCSHFRNSLSTCHLLHSHLNRCDGGSVGLQNTDRCTGPQAPHSDGLVTACWSSESVLIVDSHVTDLCWMATECCQKATVICGPDFHQAVIRTL